MEIFQSDNDIKEKRERNKQRQHKNNFLEILKACGQRVGKQMNRISSCDQNIDQLMMKAIFGTFKTL